VGGSRAPAGATTALRVQGLPLVKPPYGSIVAIDMDKGEILWTIANAETPDNVRNHPALKGLNIPRTGRQSNTIGMLVTKTLMIAGEPGTFTTPDGRVGAMLRAYDKRSGKELGAVYMPAGQTGTPMTYSLNGKQYIVVAIGGQGYGAELLAFKLSN
jgi:quinoprotein glucose dehydrogenase